MKTQLHTKAYTILFLLALLMETTRVAGSLTEFVIFLGFVVYEFVVFAFEANLFKERKTQNDHLPTC